MYSSFGSNKPLVESTVDSCSDEKDFVEFRRKVRGAEVLSAAMEKLLKSVKFSGRISVVVQNGRVLKSGYEEGFFRQTDRLLEQTASEP